jgi:tRNA A-37 threonylcarbamoyl transferase component Bud32
MNFIFFASKIERGLRFFIAPGAGKLGRSPEATFVIADKRVSRFHALVEREGDTVWLTDLNSRNGTFVNQRRLEEEVRTLLLPGDEIAFGGETHSFYIYGNSSSTSSATTDALPATVTEATQAGSGHTLAEIDPLTPLQHPVFDDGLIAFADEGVDLRTAERLATRYRPIQLLRAGGMGKIFLVQERLSSRFVALKVMLERYLNSEPHVHQFVREAVITARLQHPHIIPVFDLGFIEGNQLYYTMRYVDGEHLSKTMQSGNLELVLRLLRQAASAVDYAHSLGLWHRDLKPDNILVSRAGEAFVIDWGLVSIQPGQEYKLDIPRILIERESFVFTDTLLSDTEDAISTMEVMNNAAGSVPLIGTPAYMAPEQCRGDVQWMGILSDVWAFGVMLFEALTGQHPIGDHRTVPPREITHRITNRPFPSPELVRSGLPATLKTLCVRMLVHDPVDRLPNLQAFVQELDRYLSPAGA